MKKILSTILALFVLSTSIGAPFSKHTCFSDNKTKYGFDIHDECCEKVPETTTTYIITECCEFYSTYLQVDFDAFSLLKTFSFIPPVNDLTVSFEQGIIQEIIKIYPPEDRAPPKSGRLLLSFIQSFLI